MHALFALAAPENLSKKQHWIWYKIKASCTSTIDAFGIRLGREVAAPLVVCYSHIIAPDDLEDHQKELDLATELNQNELLVIFGSHTNHQQT